MKKIQINYVNYGIGNRFQDYIELNKRLLDKKYSVLLNEIIKHELSHTNTGWSMNDLFLDLKGFSNKRLYWRFVFSNPSTWVQFSPIYLSNNRWYFDLTLIIFYAVSIMFFGLLWMIMKMLT